MVNKNGMLLYPIPQKTARSRIKHQGVASSDGELVTGGLP